MEASAASDMSPFSLQRYCARIATTVPSAETATLVKSFAALGYEGRIATTTARTAQDLGLVYCREVS